MCRPTQIVREGLGFSAAKGPSVKEDMLCMTCGRTIHAGETAIKWSPMKGTFTDWQYLASNSRHVCEDCAVLRDNQALKYLQTSVVSREGVWNLGKDTNRMWFVQSPPEPPFVAVVGTAKKQHLAWKASATLDRDLLLVQLGNTLIDIDRPLVLDAVQWIKRARELGEENKHKIGTFYPYVFLCRKCASTTHGTINNKFRQLARENEEAKELLDKFLCLGEGELWALSFMAKSLSVEPFEEKII